MFVVIYRTGGTLNYKWHTTVNFQTFAEAQQCAKASERMGYPSRVICAAITH